MKPSAAILSVLLTLALLAAPGPADAQQPGKVYRIGWLGSNSGRGETDAHGCPQKGLDTWQAGLAGLRERGYVPGQNLLIECRWTEGRSERTFSLAAEIVGLQPDLIVAVGGTARYVKRATSTIPIVMVGTLDPVGGFLVETLARPGGNLTGLTFSAGLEVFGEQLQLLKEAVPTAARVTVLTYGGPARYQGTLDAAARALGLTLQSRDLWAPEELAGDFAKMITAGVDALLGETNPYFVAYHQQIADLALQHRLPSLFPYRALTEAGALMSYGPNEAAYYRRLGSYVDRIFKGEKPGEIPVEQPTKFELVINRKAAKALGLTIPQSLLMRADEVIE
jgi:ABC-type uncharacterized transport system substrate-binding protein